MIAIIGSIIGLLGSSLPKVFEFFQDRSDRAHELKVMQLQIEAARKTQEDKLEEIRVSGEIKERVALYGTVRPTGSKFIDGLRGSVRPIITYLFFGLFAAVKISAMLQLMKTGGASVHEALLSIWDEQTQAIFSTIIAFWFGTRAFSSGKNAK